MKINVILAILVVALGYMTCKNLKKTTAPQDPAMAGAPASQNNTLPLQTQAPPQMVVVPIEKLPPATASRKAYLSTGWWRIPMAYQPNDSTVHLHYQSKWLRFREDQTFDILINNKVADTGRWNYDETKNDIYLSCNDPYINNTWRVMEKGFIMIWKGNTDINVTGIQVRLEGVNTPPPDN